MDTIDKFEEIFAFYGGHPFYSIFLDTHPPKKGGSLILFWVNGDLSKHCSMLPTHIFLFKKK